MLNIKQINLNDKLDWSGLIENSSTASFFQTKEWLQLWVKHFSSKGRSASGRGGEAIIFGVYDDGKLISIAPFEITENTINFLGVNPVAGGELVSDFGDIIAKNGREKEVWEAILFQYSPGRSPSGHLPGVAERLLEGEYRIELNFIRENSPSFKILQELGGKIEEIDVAPYMDLPNTWEEYLSILNRHDRHEIRRKMRKADKEGVIKVCDEINTQNINDFFRLMIASNENKRKFLSGEMKNFFSEVIEMLGHKQLLTLCFLRYENVNIASILLMYQKNEVLLYNSGFDPKYSFLSPGLILNAYAIRGAIEEGKDRFDFLRGGEKYKYDLGGVKRNLYKISF
ncbi:GNAT family N-acetyltransferase [Candidatus Gottesmanbacteria bacterium]|nr:GNAT family N-acetyltransferase [Candidatus Gottesmanbacteria bacterium]